jgi:hypothetical protein
MRGIESASISSTCAQPGTQRPSGTAQQHLQLEHIKVLQPWRTVEETERNAAATQAPDLCGAASWAVALSLLLS